MDDRLLLGVGFWGRGKGELGVDEVRETSPSEAVSSSESLSNDSVDWWSSFSFPAKCRTMRLIQMGKHFLVLSKNFEGVDFDIS